MLDKQQSGLTGVILTLLLITGCGVSGLDGIMGGGQTNDSMSNELRGTIGQIDLRDQYFVLTQVDRMSSNLVNRDDNTRIYFDDRTSVTYEGETYRPEDLEEGDQVAVRVSRSGNRLLATSMTVLHDVSGRSGARDDMRTTRVQGTVQDVNTARQTIDIDPGLSRPMVTLLYDENTIVTYNGQRYDPADLERGDQVDINGRDMKRGQWLAEDINVTRHAMDQTNSTMTSTVRGTVRDIDTERQTIDLEQTRLGTNFNSRIEDLLTLQYDANTIVEYQGDRYDPSNIERGDVVDVDVQEIGRRQFAQRIVVVRDVRTLR